METTLHQQLKRHYAGEAGQTEVQLGRYRIDAVRGEELIEVQCASLSAIRDKCQNLLKRHRLRVVKPVVIRTRIRRLTSDPKKAETGKTKSLRPKRGSAIDLFDELIYFTRVFPHPNLTIEVPLIHVEQVRVPSRKKRRRSWHKDYRVKDVLWESTESTLELSNASDLLTLLPGGETMGQANPSGHFNTAELAKTIGKSRQTAQQIAYVLRKTGAIDQHSRNRSGIVYRRAA